MKNRHRTWTTLRSILLAVILIFFGRTLYEPVIIDGESMEPTIQDQERILVSKTIAWHGQVERGDVVIIATDDPTLNYVKRVVAKEGEVIEIKDDQLFINQQLVSEPYLHEYKVQAHSDNTSLTADFGPVTVPDNHYFVMGDNRSVSVDSRGKLGFIAENRIVAKGEFVFYPFENARFIH